MPERAQVVERYLQCMVANDWDGLAKTLRPDVVRKGPYRDDFDGRDAYVEFLKATFAWMRDYDMQVVRMFGDGAGRVCVELAETVTLDGARLRTDEAIVFDVHDDLIARVQVFLQRSYDPEA